MSLLVSEFLDELKTLEETHGLRITVEGNDLTLKLVSKFEDHRAVAYTNTEFFPESADELDIIREEAARVTDKLEVEQNGEEV